MIDWCPCIYNVIFGQRSATKAWQSARFSCRRHWDRPPPPPSSSSSSFYFLFFFLGRTRVRLSRWRWPRRPPTVSSSSSYSAFAFQIRTPPTEISADLPLTQPGRAALEAYAKQAYDVTRSSPLFSVDLYIGEWFVESASRVPHARAYPWRTNARKNPTRNLSPPWYASRQCDLSTNMTRFADLATSHGCRKDSHLASRRWWISKRRGLRFL